MCAPGVQAGSGRPLGVAQVQGDDALGDVGPLGHDQVELHLVVRTPMHGSGLFRG